MEYFVKLKEKMKTEDYVKLPEHVKLGRQTGFKGQMSHLVERGYKKAMYVRDDGVWEVFKIKVRKDATVFNKFVPAHEIYPGNEDFGKFAWCYDDEKDARERYAHPYSNYRVR